MTCSSILYLSLMTLIYFASMIGAIPGCAINPFKVSQPIAISSNNKCLIYPKPGETNLYLKVGETIDVACPTGKVTVSGVDTRRTILPVTCAGDERFNVLGEELPWNEMSCTREHVVRARFTNQTCENGGKEAEVGFDLGEDRFLRFYQLCCDSHSQTPLYSHMNLTSSIGSSAKGIERPFFIQDPDFYNVDVNSLFDRKAQRRTINSLVGLDTNSKKYIRDGPNFFLSRGHLSAKGDFVYAPQQIATCRYINQTPQWQPFNGYNWNEVEISTRNYAERNNADLQIWTGVYGVATLPHEETGKEVQLYLYVDSKGNKAIPVPELYWKVVYNPATKKGIALIGINNPYQIEKTMICDDISDQLSWLTWDKRNSAAGYSYACSVADLKKVVDYAPNLKVSGLLV